MLSACFQLLVFAASMNGAIAASKFEDSLMILDNLIHRIKTQVEDFNVLFLVICAILTRFAS